MDIIYWKDIFEEHKAFKAIGTIEEFAAQNEQIKKLQEKIEIWKEEFEDASEKYMVEQMSNSYNEYKLEQAKMENAVYKQIKEEGRILPDCKKCDNKLVSNYSYPCKDCIGSFAGKVDFFEPATKETQSDE